MSVTTSHSPDGSWIAGKVPAQRLQGLFGWFIVVMAVFVLAQEVPRTFGHPVDLGVDWPWVFGLVVAAIGVAFATVARQRRTARIAEEARVSAARFKALQAAA